MSVRLIHPDEGNMIDLPGVGPCPRPVDIDQSVTGFSRLKSLRAYRFKAGQTIEGESELDEVLISPLSGAITLEISGRSTLTAELEAASVLYMPPDHAYRLTACENAIVAYGRADATGELPASLPTTHKGEALSLDQVSLAAGDAHALGGGECLGLVVSGRVACAEREMGPLDVIALSDGDSAEVTANGAAQLWVYSA